MAYFQTKKSKFGYILEGLAMDDVGIFGTILSIVVPFGIFCGHFRYFFIFGIFSLVLVFCTKKNLATLSWTVHRGIWAREKWGGGDFLTERGVEGVDVRNHCCLHSAKQGDCTFFKHVDMRRRHFSNLTTPFYG
jgi:hypothetical protein